MDNIYIEKSTLNISAEAVMAQMPGIVTWFDIESICYGSNLRNANNLGFSAIEEIIGVGPFGARNCTARYGDTFIAQNQKAIKQDRAISMLEIQRFADNRFHILLSQKAPLKQTSGEVLGVVYNGVDVVDNRIKYLGYCLLQDSPSEDYLYYELSDFNPRLNFSKRESETLFYLLRGKTAKAIAHILGISIKTIETYIANIKTKMHCYSKTEIIEKSIELGYLSVIPKSLLMSDLPETLS